MFISPRLSPSSNFTRVSTSNIYSSLSHSTLRTSVFRGLRKVNVSLSGRISLNSCFHSYPCFTPTSIHHLNMSRRRHSTQQNENSNGNSNGHSKPKKDDHDHNHDHEENGHEHSHSHSLFGGHSHGDEYNYGAEKIMAAWDGGGDRGSRITIIGLLSNVALVS